MKRARFHTLTVASIRRLTANAVEVAFEVPEAIADEFDYSPGQYVALRAKVPSYDGTPVELRRSYSLTAPPGHGQLKVGIKKDRGGLFSTWANETLKPGDTVDVMSPQGTFVSKEGLVTPGANRHIVAVAAGSGITPVMSIARSILAADTTSTVDIIYANRSTQDVMFVEELADLKDANPARVAVYHVLSREQRLSPLLTGRLDEDKLRELVNRVINTRRTDEWFLCGPLELVDMVRTELKALGVDDSRVRFELFNTGEVGDPTNQQARPIEIHDDTVTRGIDFQLDGLRGTVATPVEARESILAAALRARPDVPFACSGGVCGTCRAKLVEGTVDMAENYALEPDEVAAGYILTCQSVPTSDKVVINYDA